jgi:hypothetical protein
VSGPTSPAPAAEDEEFAGAAAAGCPVCAAAEAPEGADPPEETDAGRAAPPAAVAAAGAAPEAAATGRLPSVDLVLDLLSEPEPLQAATASASSVSVATAELRESRCFTVVSFQRHNEIAGERAGRVIRSCAAENGRHDL